MLGKHPPIGQGLVLTSLEVVASGLVVFHAVSLQGRGQWLAANCATLSAVTRSRVWAALTSDPRVLLNIRQIPAMRARRIRLGMGMIRKGSGGRTVPCCWGQHGRVIHRSGRSLPCSLPLPEWGTTVTATPAGCMGSGSGSQSS